MFLLQVNIHQNTIKESALFLPFFIKTCYMARIHLKDSETIFFVQLAMDSSKYLSAISTKETWSAIKPRRQTFGTRLPNRRTLCSFVPLHSSVVYPKKHVFTNLLSYPPYTRILGYNSCLISMSESVSDGATKISVLRLRLPLLCVFNTFCARRRVKVNILESMYVLISIFATQKFCSI